MATVQWVIFKHHKKSDGTYNPKIQIIHKSLSAYIPSGVNTECVRFRKGHSSGSVTDSSIEDSLNDKVRKIRAILNEKEEIISEMDTAKEVKDYVLKILDAGSEIDFLRFANEYKDKIKNESTKAYNVTRINALTNYVVEKTGKPSLPISKLTHKLLKDYEDWLRTTNRKSKKADKEKCGLSENSINSYMGALSIIFNAAKKKYNDYNVGDILIKNDPFKVNTYAAYCDGDHNKEQVTNESAPNQRNILLIRDSFSCTLMPYLALYTKNITTLDLRLYKTKSVYDYIRRHPDIDTVIVAYNPSSITEEQYTFDRVVNEENN